MTLNELLVEWSYRTEKGYPDMGNPSDILILKNILNELNLPSNEIITNLGEAALNPSELSKDRGPNIGPGLEFNDRIEKFLDKIRKGEEFELIDGSKITIDINSSSSSIERLEKKDIKGKILLFIDTKGSSYSLSKFKKTKEFGAGSGSGGGTTNTMYQESAHCFGCAVAYYLKKGNITPEDLTLDNFTQVESYVEMNTTLDKVVSFLESSPAWKISISKSVNKILSLFPNKNYEFHRGSSFVDKIYNAWKVGKKEQGLKLADDKWNPADIWLVSDTIKNVDFSNELGVLNGEISQFYDDGDLIGVSLKAIKKEATHTVYNDPNIPSNNIYEYESYKSTAKSASTTIVYKGGSIVFRNFSVDRGFAAEINGAGAQGGKAGHSGINDVLKLNNIPQLPSSNEVLKAFTINDKEYYSRLYNLYNKFIENISEDNFKKIFKEKPLSWKTGKFMSLELLSKILDNKDEKINEILNDIMRYAASSTKISSQFIKIS